MKAPTLWRTGQEVVRTEYARKHSTNDTMGRYPHILQYLAARMIVSEIFPILVNEMKKEITVQRVD